MCITKAQIKLMLIRERKQSSFNTYASRFFLGFDTKIHHRWRCHQYSSCMSSHCVREWSWCLYELPESERRVVQLQLNVSNQLWDRDCWRRCTECMTLWHLKACTLVESYVPNQILYDATQTLGPKGELKLMQWIRGSVLAWTDA